MPFLQRRSTWQQPDTLQSESSPVCPPEQPASIEHSDNQYIKVIYQFPEHRLLTERLSK